MKLTLAILSVCIGIADFVGVYIAVWAMLGVYFIFDQIDPILCIVSISFFLSGMILCALPFRPNMIENTTVAVINALLCFGFWPCIFAIMMREDFSVLSARTIALCIANFLLMFTARPMRDIQHLAHG